MKKQRGDVFEVRVEYREKFDTQEEAMAAKEYARAALKKIKERNRLSVSSCITIRGGLEMFLSHRETYKNNCASTIKDHKRHLLFWADALSCGAGDIPLDAISIEAVDVAVASLRKRLSGGTVNKYLCSLFSFAHWARGRNLVPENCALIGWMLTR
jgi:hypothetical protein